MKRTVSTLILITIWFAAVSSLSARALQSGQDPLSLIRSDYQAGAITVDQKANLYIDAIRYPKRLPAKYASRKTLAEAPAGCPTIALKEVKTEWAELSPETQQRFSEAFARLSTAFTYVTPSGFFTIHYDITGGDAVPSADANSNTIPDYIERCAAYLDSSLDKLTEQGYLLPPSDEGLGGDNTFDVYFQEMGFYGYAVPENDGPAAWNDYYSHLTLHRNFIGFPPNNDPEGDQLGAAKVTIAHEFRHCCQFAYDASEFSWVMELDATYMEDIVFNATDDNYNYLGSFFSTPQKSLMDESIHMYACFTWHLYLAQKFDTSLIRSAWEGARFTSAYNALSDSLLGHYGWTQDSAFADYAVWNYITNTKNDGLHHEEAGAYPAMTVGQSYSTYPVTMVPGPSNPAGYAASYVQFFPGSSVGKLQINVDGENGRQWKFYVVKSTADNVHAVEEIVAPSPGYSGSLLIPQFESYFRVALVAVNVSEFSAPGVFTYSATVTPPYQVAGDILTDSLVYSGKIRIFKYNLSNPSIIPDIYAVIVSDSLGWLPLDTVNVAVEAGQDSLLSFQVRPQQGTPLGAHSMLRFVARSWGDSSVVDTSTINAVTILQRGDVNFSGNITVADLTYLVQFLFGGGAAPLPVVLAADANCSNTITVADLSFLVQRLFNLGASPPCNPF